MFLYGLDRRYSARSRVIGDSLGAPGEDSRKSSPAAKAAGASREELVEAIENITTTRAARSLVDDLELAGVPCAPILDYAQVFTDETLRQRDFFWDAPHPTLGPVEQLGSPMRFSRTPVRRANAGPPL